MARRRVAGRAIPSRRSARSVSPSDTSSHALLAWSQSEQERRCRPPSTQLRPRGQRGSLTATLSWIGAPADDAGGSRSTNTRWCRTPASTVSARGREPKRPRKRVHCPVHHHDVARSEQHANRHLHQLPRTRPRIRCRCCCCAGCCFRPDSRGGRTKKATSWPQHRVALFLSGRFRTAGTAQNLVFTVVWDRQNRLTSPRRTRGRRRTRRSRRTRGTHCARGCASLRRARRALGVGHGPRSDSRFAIGDD